MAGCRTGQPFLFLGGVVQDIDLLLILALLTEGPFAGEDLARSFSVFKSRKDKHN
jgi:hypothetical protein